MTETIVLTAEMIAVMAILGLTICLFACIGVFYVMLIQLRRLRWRAMARALGAQFRFAGLTFDPERIKTIVTMLSRAVDIAEKNPIMENADDSKV